MIRLKSTPPLTLLLATSLAGAAAMGPAGRAHHRHLGLDRQREQLQRLAEPDAGGLTTSYGGPTGLPIPGGPLAFTVTASS